MSALKVMIVDDEKHVRESLQQTLTLEDFDIEACESAQEALKIIEANWEGIVITDINMPHMNGVELLERIQAIDSDIPVIVLTGHGNVSLAVEAMRLGAYDFLEKPFSVDILLETVHRAVEKRTLTLENRSLRRELEASELPGPRIIGRSPGVVKMRTLLDKVKDTPADVLINGETGTGKELVARYLHHHSKRSLSLPLTVARYLKQSSKVSCSDTNLAHSPARIRSVLGNLSTPTAAP